MRYRAGTRLAALAAALAPVGAATGCATARPAAPAAPTAKAPAAAPAPKAPAQPPAPAAAPQSRPAVGPGDAQYRFEILRTSDSTFTFVARNAEWLRVGSRGIVVDPRRRDALVARFQALGRRADSVVALVTGQTTDISTGHVVLLTRPPVPTFRQRAFWVGLLAGGAAGAGAAIIAR